VITRRCETVAVEPTFVDEVAQVDYPLVTPTSRGSITGDAKRSHITAMIIEASEDSRCCVNFETDGGIHEDVLLGLRGRHQVINAAVAVALTEELRKQGFAISSEAIKCGLESVRHAGRLEIWDTKPPILFDGAHNPAAAQALRDYLDEFVKEPITMIFGAMRDKALEEMASILFPAADELILTEIDNPRSASLDTLKSISGKTRASCRTHCASSPAAGLQIATAITRPESLICVTGSLYLIGSVQNVAKTARLESSSAKA